MVGRAMRKPRRRLAAPASTRWTFRPLVCGGSIGMSAAQFAADTVRYALGLLLACAALGKGVKLAGFRENLHESFRVPATAAIWLAPFIVLTEAVLAVATLAAVESARPALAAA